MDQQEATKRFYDLIWPHRSVVLRIAQMMTRRLHEAEDLAQDTLMKAFKAIEQFDPQSDAKKWLLSILRNARIDRIRASASSAGNVSLDQLPMEIEDSQETSHSGGDENWNDPRRMLEQFSDRDMIAALQDLSEEIRWTLLLVDVEGLDHHEAAAILNVPVGTIKSRAHRGRAMVRQSLLAVSRR
ncbi:MAG TPA: sigma-70 family RNA polymerase sigma factor [Tepidisphaeraceae bacterium]|nr:sigma-70 family RNA polymerase sigma factor [Tepidisphaeraceae bacterium]